MSTVQILVTLKRFFREQLLKQAHALILVTITILIASIMSLLNDVLFTIFQLQAGSANDESDGLAITCLIIWVPSFTINLLHLKNIRTQQRVVEEAARQGIDLTDSILRIGKGSAEVHDKAKK